MSYGSVLVGRGQKAKIANMIHPEKYKQTGFQNSLHFCSAWL